MRFNPLLSWRTARKTRVAQEEMAYNKKLVELENFCQVGERFFYLGRQMVCLNHEWGYPDVGNLLGIRAHYVNYQGDLVTYEFPYSQLSILRKENEQGRTVIPTIT